MENQPITNSSDISPANSILVNPPPVLPQTKANLLMPVLLTFLVSAAIFGIGGYYLGRQAPTSSPYTSNDQIESLPTTEPQAITPTASPSLTQESAVIPGWKDYSISLINLAFQYPPSLFATTDINNSTALSADKEYWVAVDGSDVLYLDTFLYESDKTPTEWWNTEGKSKFEKLADEIEGVMSPKPSVNLTYTTQPSTLAGKQTLNVTVSSDYESPHTPKQRFLTIVQQNGYIVMNSYHDQGTTDSSIDISKKILSTFKFTN